MKLSLYEINMDTGSIVECDESNGNKNNLRRGQVLQLHGYSDPKFVITKNCGVSSSFPSHGSKYECVNLETGSQGWKYAHELEWISRKKSNRIQTYIVDAFLSGPDLDRALARAEQVRLDIEREEEEKRERQRREIEELPNQHPHLKPGDQAAKNIRRDLKKHFPGVKFSVRSDRRGGSSVSIRWTDGPTEKQVSEITDRYAEGSFDGMTDCYDYDRDNMFARVFGGSKYVFTTRSLSLELIRNAAIEIGFDINPDEIGTYGNFSGLDLDETNMIYRHARKLSF